jgi:hypothetical protein
VAHISLVFREMWETANLDWFLNRKNRPVQGCSKRPPCNRLGAAPLTPAARLDIFKKFRISR